MGIGLYKWDGIKIRMNHPELSHCHPYLGDMPIRLVKIDSKVIIFYLAFECMEKQTGSRLHLWLVLKMQSQASFSLHSHANF